MIGRPRAEGAVEDFLRSRLGSMPARDSAVAGARRVELLEAAGFRFEGRIELPIADPMPVTSRLQGLTEVDAIAILEEHGPIEPAVLPVALAKRLRAATSTEVARIHTDRRAVRVSWRDGIDLRLLPAARSDAIVRMADHSGRGWFGISPAFFAAVLLTQHARLDDHLIPVIRLAKRCAAGRRETRQLTGYHVETLAIAVFRPYGGPIALTPMLGHFFRAAAEAVLRPLVDAAGASLHIDDDLETADSPDRRRIGRAFTALAMRIAAATDLADWQRLLGPAVR